MRSGLWSWQWLHFIMLWIFIMLVAAFDDICRFTWHGFWWAKFSWYNTMIWNEIMNVAGFYNTVLAVTKHVTCCWLYREQHCLHNSKCSSKPSFCKCCTTLVVLKFDWLGVFGPNNENFNVHKASQTTACLWIFSVLTLRPITHVWLSHVSLVHFQSTRIYL